MFALWHARNIDLRDSVNERFPSLAALVRARGEGVPPPPQDAQDAVLGYPKLQPQVR